LSFRNKQHACYEIQQKAKTVSCQTIFEYSDVACSLVRNPHAYWHACHQVSLRDKGWKANKQNTFMQTCHLDNSQTCSKKSCDMEKHVTSLRHYVSMLGRQGKAFLRGARKNK